MGAELLNAAFKQTRVPDKYEIIGGSFTTALQLPNDHKSTHTHLCASSSISNTMIVSCGSPSSPKARSEYIPSVSRSPTPNRMT
eukprot:1160451-Pelagomonas_calceolata.AAC.20